MTRYELLEVAKRSENFPYTNATLKKCPCLRKPNELKLGNDNFILFLASIGKFSGLLVYGRHMQVAVNIRL